MKKILRLIRVIIVCLTPFGATIFMYEASDAVPWQRNLPLVVRISLIGIIIFFTILAYVMSDGIEKLSKGGEK